MYHFNDNLIINFLCFFVYDGCILMYDMNQRYITGMVIPLVVLPGNTMEHGNKLVF